MLRDGPLETARLTIRRFAPDDVDWMVALFADPAVSRFVDNGAPLSRADATLWVSRSNANINRYGYGTGAVIERTSSRPIGWAGIARPDDGGEEMIYGLQADRWRRGFGSEIVAALVALLERYRPGDAVRATIDPLNHASARLLESHGVRRAGESDDSILYVRAPTALETAVR